VLHRSLDVIFQYLVPLVLVLVGVPVTVLAVSLAVDRSQTVTARLWADQPAVLADSPYAGQSNGVTAAQSQATLLTELLQTDSFVATVLRGARSSADPTVVGADLRKNFAVVPEGPHVLLLSYSTAHPQTGMALTGAIITAFQQAQQVVQAGQVTVADDALRSQLQSARREMDDAIAAAQQYRASHGPDASLASDAQYHSLRTLANVKVDSYTALLEQAQKAAQYQSALPSVQNTVLRTLDQPRLQSQALKPSGSATKNAGYAAAAAVAIELIFVYNLTRRDQRVRTTREVVSSLGLVSLGTTPDPQPK
jgi:hypothetical protein